MENTMKIIYEKKTHDLHYRNDQNKKVPLQCRAHLHYHVEIVYMKEGYATAFIDSDTYRIETGDLLVVFPNRIHRFEDAEQQNSYDLFIVNPDLCPELAQKISTENPQNPVIHEAFKNPRLASLLKILSTAKDFPASYRQIMLKGYFLALFAEILDMLPMRNSKPDENQAMRTVVQYCSRNFTKDLSLAILEEELHLSKYYISHLFGDKLGIRFNDYVNSLRVSESCRLLRVSDMSITEIADASGFGTLRTFNRAFIKQMGVSPSDYRKKNRGEAYDISIPTTEPDQNEPAVMQESTATDSYCDTVCDDVCNTVSSTYNGLDDCASVCDI